MKEDPSSTVQTENRRLAAIMFTDIVGFSRQMGSNEARTLRLLDTHNQLIQQAVSDHRGTVIKTIGDAFLVDFPSVVHAVQCAQQIHAQLRTHNAEQEQAEQIHVRIGIHLGDIVQRDGDVFGDGVNIAARLQGLAEPDSICLSHVVYQEVEKKLSLGTVVSLGQPKLKNIDQRFPVYLLIPEQTNGVHQTLRSRGLHLIRRMGGVHWVVVGLLLSAATLGTVQYLFRPLTQDLALGTDGAPAALPLPDKPSIVILPFANLSNDPEQEYFSDGLTEDLTSALSKLSSLFVISRNTASTFKGKPVKVQEVGKELGVQYVLEGSVRKADGQVRVTAQLIDALQDHHLWTERYDRPLKDIFALQDEIVQKIVTTLKLQLTLWEQGVLVRKTTDNLEAYDYFLRGTERYWQRTKEANAQARQMFEQAVALDPQYALAYASMGRTYLDDWTSQWNRTPQVLERADELAQKAIALDNGLPGPHAILGQIYLQKLQHDQAIVEAERAITIDPNWADGYATLATILRWSGRAEEAVDLAKKAIRLNPRHPPFYQHALGFSYCSAGRYEEAMAAQKAALARNPDLLISHICLAACYSMAGRDEEARAQVKEILRISPNFSLGAPGVAPWKNPADGKPMENALRKAGLK